MVGFVLLREKLITPGYEPYFPGSFRTSTLRCRAGREHFSSFKDLRMQAVGGGDRIHPGKARKSG